MFVLAFAPSALGLTSRSLTLQVYSNGYAAVSQTFSVEPNATSVQLPLLSATVSDLIATDQNGSPLSYGFSPGGRNITVYTLGATQVSLRYDTDNLTEKVGTVWTLAFETGYNSTVVLPQFSTLASISGTPYSINQTGMHPELTLPPGSWTINYGVPFTGGSSTTGSTSSGTTTSGGGSPQGAGGPSSLLVWGAVVLVAAALVGLGIYLWLGRKRRTGPDGGPLRPDDLQVLGFIRERGGKVLEPEIRTKFLLPKTSAWRQIKRLERLGYVKVTKIGSQNQIELSKDRNVEE